MNQIIQCLSLARASFGAFLAFMLARWVTARSSSRDDRQSETFFGRAEFAESAWKSEDWAMELPAPHAFGATSLRRPAVAMMKSANSWNGDHLAV